ncbi:hypothetical protein R3X25_13230 [Lutibacter sp. TH_r2]|uniref:hypothetical protein n=1 Tax=Lutibacter sp. TH_r2 TaxID=3082083 RepID=UPI0029547D99|nr:hypothetical protein [Lutibacter sp. TH_r2]MDV7188250.1 hypothetical protein [Lutibacter sp. TH_r2]
MLKRIVYLLVVVLLVVQCTNTNQYLIEKGKVGLLTKDTKVSELALIFKSDSLVAIMNSEKDAKLFSSENDEYIVYSKNGKKVLEIEPENQQDSLSKIKSIQIFDSNYITDKGVSLKSTFSEINKNYRVNKVETTLTSATLFIDELNATIAIDKKELGLNQFSREEVSLDQIPEIAKVKFFTIWFN